MSKKIFYLCLWVTATLAAVAQTPPAASVKCSILTGVAPSQADTMLAEGRFSEAEERYAAEPPSSAATAGVVRAMLGEHKLKQALALAQKESAAHPTDALLLDVLGEVRYRRGEVDEAASTLTKSLNLDYCLGRTHYDASRYLDFQGRAKTAQAQLDVAHKLAPGDAMITQAWRESHGVRPSDDQQLAQLKERLADTSLPEDRKAGLEARMKAVQAHRAGDCTLAAPVDNAKMQLTFMGNRADGNADGKAGLDVVLNGKRKRLQVDTGASGLSITLEAARSLGLTPEAETGVQGMGDSGVRSTYITHVDDIRIGAMDFHNCIVQVYETKNILPGQEGLIGTDVFQNFLVTLDFPSMEMRLGPLPKRPDQTASQPKSLGTDADEAAPEARTDPYIAPEMKDWTPVFRSGHLLIFPTKIGKAPSKLFVMDTGAGVDLISPDVAREVTDVGADDGVGITGLSGKVAKTYSTGSMYIQFAHIRQPAESLTSIDTNNISRSVGVEIGGFIGYPTLVLLKLEIDYRDNLVHVTYTPHITGRQY